MPFALCTLALLTVMPIPGSANECAAHYGKLHDRHAQFVQAVTDRTSEQYFKDAVDLEGALFEAIHRCPGDALLLSLMAELQIDLGRFSLAAQYGQKAVSADPHLWQPHHVLGAALSMAGRHDQGIGELKEAVRLAPGNPRVLLNLASALVWADRPGEAAPMLDALTQSD